MKISWLNRLKRSWHCVSDMNIPVHSAHACYFIILSLFPSLVLLLGILRYTSLQPENLMDLLTGLIPEALELYAWNLISGTYTHTSRVVISVSVLTALWSSGRGVYALLRGMNAVYGVREDRSWLHIRLISAAYTFLFLLVLLLTLVLHVFSNTILQLLRLRMEAGILRWLEWIDLRFILLVVVQTLVFCAMYMALPRGRNGFRESLPGAMLASVGWMTVSSLFSVYVRNFSRYSNIFGSVYAVALLMLWLYVCISIVFYGGLLNRYLAGGRKEKE